MFSTNNVRINWIQSTKTKNMTLLSLPNPTSYGCYQNITPEVTNWKYVGFKGL